VLKIRRLKATDKIHCRGGGGAEAGKKKKKRARGGFRRKIQRVGKTGSECIGKLLSRIRRYISKKTNGLNGYCTCTIRRCLNEKVVKY
jgi:hypothetical protein